MVLDDTRLFRRRALALAMIAMVVVFFLWNIPQLDFILYPFRLFVTFVHEAGHGLAALITGGQFHEFVVYNNGSGQAITSGGSRAIILPSGYLGAALFGAVLFSLVNRLPYPRTISRILGIALIVFSLLFSRLIGAQLTLSIAPIVGILSGLGLFLLGQRANRDMNILVLNILAMLTALNAVMDLAQLVQYSNISLGQVRNDAAAFSAEITPLIPAAVWGFIWALLAVLMLGLSVWFSIIHPLRRG